MNWRRHLPHRSNTADGQRSLRGDGAGVDSRVYQRLAVALAALLTGSSCSDSDSSKAKPAQRIEALPKPAPPQDPVATNILDAVRDDANSELRDFYEDALDVISTPSAIDVAPLTSTTLQDVQEHALTDAARIAGFPLERPPRRLSPTATNPVAALLTDARNYAFDARRRCAPSSWFGLRFEGGSGEKVEFALNSPCDQLFVFHKADEFQVAILTRSAALQLRSLTASAPRSNDAALLIELTLAAPELSPYLYDEAVGKMRYQPLAITVPEGQAAPTNVSQFGKPVRVVARDKAKNAFNFSGLPKEGATEARLQFNFAPEGLVGRASFTKERGIWYRVEVEINER